jgi:hypothetical protein
MISKSSWQATAALAILLAVPGSLHSAEERADQPTGSSVRVPSGQVNRYIIPNFSSVLSSNPTPTMTVVTVMNLSPVSCNAAVSFQQGGGTTNTCVINLAIPSRTARIFCSRNTNYVGVAGACVIGVCPGGGLTFNAGHAYVSSTNSTDCSRIGVDAREYVMRDGADNALQAESKLTVIGLSRNAGD